MTEASASNELVPAQLTALKQIKALLPSDAESLPSVRYDGWRQVTVLIDTPLDQAIAMVHLFDLTKYARSERIGKVSNTRILHWDPKFFAGLK